VFSTTLKINGTHTIQLKNKENLVESTDSGHYKMKEKQRIMKNNKE